MFDSSRLRQKIIAEYGTIRAFASAMGLSDSAISGRLSNKSQWRHSEIEKAVEILHIVPADIGAYFFALL